MLGADWERGNWLAGLALTRSEGEGNLRQRGGRKRVYESESTMTSISPYLRLRLSERLLVWGLAGGGRGDLTMEEKVAAGAPVVYRTDLSMTLAAAGLQSDLFTLDETGGYGLSAFGGRLTQTPYLGFGDSDGNQSMRLGWWLTAPTGLFETSLEALRRRQDSGSSDSGIGLLATARW